MHSFVPTVLLWLTRLDTLVDDTQSLPLERETRKAENALCQKMARRCRWGFVEELRTLAWRTRRSPKTPFYVHLTFQRLIALRTIFTPTAIKTRLNSPESHPPPLVVQLIKKSATAR